MPSLRTRPGTKHLPPLRCRTRPTLTAASILARQRPDDGPHLVYLPETVFDPEAFLADVAATYERLGRCVVAVSEGIHDADGKPFLQVYAEQAGSALAGERDTHGNVQLSGTGALGDALANLVKERLGGIRVLRHAGGPQRACTRRRSTSTHQGRSGGRNRRCGAAPATPGGKR